MKVTYWQRGESLDYKNTTDNTIPENTVIPIVSRIGVTGMAIEPKQMGSLHVTGVFEMPKEPGTAISMGTMVYLSGDTITNTSDGNIPAGYAAQDAAAEDAKVIVKLLG